jgi:hypothetical protein
MPRATISVEPEQFELKSCPGGWIKLRRMSYGERLHRQDIAMTMSMQADTRAKSGKMEIKQAQTAVAAFELATCVVDHNLDRDDAGTKLNFSSPVDVDQLDGRIGEEIAALIEELHDWDNNLPNYEQRSSSSSSEVAKVQPVVNRPTLRTESSPNS